jgi:hypothetical protein
MILTNQDRQKGLEACKDVILSHSLRSRVNSAKNLGAREKDSERSEE